MTAKILIVEDEEKTGHYLQKGLEETGFSAQWLADGLEGYKAETSNSWCLMRCSRGLTGLILCVFCARPATRSPY